MYVATLTPSPYLDFWVGKDTDFQQKGNWVIVLTDYALDEHKKRMEKERIKGARKIDPARLQWKPPVFTASSRTWNW